MPTSPRLSPDVLVPRRSGAGAGSGPRVAFYSHDTQGLGHVRRNSLLAAAMVAAHPDVNVLLLSGASEAGALPLPDRTDIVTVPGLAKDVTGRYRARELDCSLEQVLAVRSAALESVLVNFAPDLLVVDKVPRGILGELEPGLRRVRREHGTRTVLGLRDVLDDVTTTRREWRDSRSREAIRSLYDQVWVYGDHAVFDPAEVYGWTPDVRKKVRYTGYLGAGRDQLLPVRPASHGAPSVCGEIPTSVRPRPGRRRAGRSRGRRRVRPYDVPAGPPRGAGDRAVPPGRRPRGRREAGGATATTSASTASSGTCRRW